MENQFIFPGTSSDEIDDFIENNLYVKDGNERNYYILNICTNYYCKEKI
jgi:hypothetical protein